MPIDLLPRAVRLALAWEVGGGDAVAPGLGAELLWAALPAPGDPQGLPPAVVRETDGDDADGAVVVRARTGTWALLPTVTRYGSRLEPGESVAWRVMDAGGPGVAVRPPSLAPGEARLALVSALHEATDTLTALDVAKERPELREAFLDLTGPPDPDVGELLVALDDRRAALLVQAARVLRIVELAREDDGAAVTAGQVAARSAALGPLGHAARSAVAVATLRRV
ncbi:hypothetical protein [Salana multivorans]|uniref:hypothetical protein n=1 Tax=Salana multivorans TaxID=120377 RepID=UPI002490E6CB|nr:hypothetical protein [Salana multivorans]